MLGRAFVIDGQSISSAAEYSENGVSRKVVAQQLTSPDIFDWSTEEGSRILKVRSIIEVKHWT